MARYVRVKDSELGVPAMYRILKKSGASRVSSGSAEELRRITEEAAMAVAAEAVRMARHAKRKTVMAEDVRAAAGSPRFK